MGTMGMKDRALEYGRRRPLVAMAAGVAMLGALVAIDANRLVRAHQVLGTRADRPLQLGIGSAVLTALGLIWLVRSAGPARRVAIGFVGFLGVLGGLVVFGLSHPRHGDNTPMSAFDVGAVAFFAAAAALSAVGIPIVVLRRRSEEFASARPHRPEDQIEVWHMRDTSRTGSYEPYFTTSCPCGWAGETYPASDPDAREHAFAEAHSHGTNVASAVAYPLD